MRKWVLPAAATAAIVLVAADATPAQAQVIIRSGYSSPGYYYGGYTPGYGGATFGNGTIFNSGFGGYPSYGGYPTYSGGYGTFGTYRGYSNYGASRSFYGSGYGTNRYYGGGGYNSGRGYGGRRR